MSADRAIMGVFFGCIVTLVCVTVHLGRHPDKEITMAPNVYVAPPGDDLCQSYRTWQKQSHQTVEKMEVVCIKNPI